MTVKMLKQIGALALLTAAFAVSGASGQTFIVESINPDGSNLRTSGVVSTEFAWNVGGGSDETTGTAAGISWSDSRPSGISAINNAEGTLTDRELDVGNSFSSPFDEVMDDYPFSADNDPNANRELNFDLTGLTVGDSYRLQTLHARDATVPDGDNRLVFGTDQNNDPGVDYNWKVPGSSDPGTSGGGALVISEFVAGSTSQTITLFGTSNDTRAVINGVALQVIPEPGAYALIGGSLALGAVLLRRRRS